MSILSSGRADAPTIGAPEVTVLRAAERLSIRRYLREVFEHRRLVRVLSGRSLKAKHDMNLVGFVWWLLEPLTFMAMYFVIVEVLFSRGTEAFLLFLLIPLLSYKWLIQSVTGSMATIRANNNLITNLYFPRALLPIVELSVGLAHFLVGLLVIPGLMIYYGVTPTWHLVWLPLVVAVQFILLMGLAFPSAVIGIPYKNLPRLVGNIFRIWFYLSPGIWSLDLIQNETLLMLQRINPLTGLFESYRGAIMYGHPPGWELLSTLGFGLVGLIAGGLWFVRRESTFGKVVV